MCRSDHGYSIACKRTERGRRWSVTCGVSSAGHTLSRIANNCSSSIPHASCRQGSKSEHLLLQRNAKQKEAARDERSLAASVGVLWRCPTLPQPGGCSTIGAAGLSFQVRNGCWAFPRCYDHHKTGVQHVSPAPCCLVGVWVDRVLYSGCGCFVACLVVHPHVLCGLLFSVGPLVPVGSRAPRGASTSGLSTRSSGGGLSPHGGRGNLILEQASRLDAFSGYPFRT